MHCELVNPSDARPVSGTADGPRSTLLMATALSFLLVGLPAAGAGEAPASEGHKAPSGTPNPQTMTVRRAGSRASFPGPAEYFTGTVRVDMLFRAKEPSRVTGAYVTFEPGARSAWHTHPLGQHLVATAGTGWVQQEGGERQEIRPGDVLWTPPGVKHWHGATATAGMTHLALQEELDGRTVEWLEKVTDEEYDGADTDGGPSSDARLTPGAAEDALTVAPALERYTRAALLGDVWKRPELSPRDRSLVTIAALVARNQAAEMSDEIARALDNAVAPAEISEIITHLAFYSGWPNALSAAAVAKDIFTERGVTVAELPPASGGLLPLDEAAEQQRAARVEQTFGPVAPGVVKYTTELLFRDLWLRPALAPRDRSLVTVSALIATGQAEQLPFHLTRAMDNGLTRTEASEMLTQLAFYAGWPKVFSALPVVKDVFEKRP
jgi:4-carboxymuconolactone decarboxylase